MSDPVYIGYYTLTDAVSMPSNARFIMYDPAGPGSYNITGALLKAQILASPVMTGQTTIPAGTAALPSLTTAGDLNTGVHFPAADTVAIATGGVSRFTFGSTGNLLLGTATARTVEIAGGGTAGTTPKCTIETTASTGFAGINLVHNASSASNYGPTINLTRTEGGTIGDNTIVSAGASLGGIAWAGADGADTRTKGAEIFSKVEGTPAANAIPAYLAFATNSGTTSPTERMRVTSSGNVLVGRTAETTVPKLQVGFANPAASPTYSANVDVAVFNSLNAAVLQVQGPTSSGIGFSSDTTRSAGYIGYTHSTNSMEFRTNATAKMVLTNDGNLLVNNTASVGAYPLQVTGASYFNGNIHTTGGLVWSFGTGSWQFRNSSKSTILEAIGNDGTGLLYLRSGSAATSGSHVVIADVYSGNVLVGANNEHPNPAKTQISSSTLGLSVKADSADTARFWRPVNSVSAAAGRILFGGYVDTSTYGDYASIGAIIENSALATKAGAIEFKTANAGTLTEKMRLTGDGKLQIGGTTAASYHTYIYNVNKFDTSLFVNQTSSTTKTAYGMQLHTTFTESDNTTVRPVNLFIGQRVVVPNTITKVGGYHAGTTVNNLRNYKTVASGGDSGTAYELKGVFAQAGHFNSNASETPTTQLVKCFHATPHAMTGTISNMYGLFIGTQVGTATVTNKWGVYQEDGNYKNYFAGEMRVGSITEILPYKLQVYTDTDGANGAVIKNASTGTAADVRFVLSNSNSVFQIVKYGANHSTRASEVNIYQGGTADVYFATNDTERIRIKGATGNLLVGTSTDPGYGAKIHSTAGISLGNTAVANGNVLDWYEEGTFTATATGMTTAPTGTVKYTRNGNIVVLDLPAISGTSNATTFTLTGMPSQLRPVTVKTVLLLVADNSGAAVYGKGSIGTDGILTIYKGPNGDAFTASGVKTVWAFSVTYTLQ